MKTTVLLLATEKGDHSGARPVVCTTNTGRSRCNQAKLKGYTVGVLVGCMGSYPGLNPGENLLFGLSRGTFQV